MGSLAAPKTSTDMIALLRRHYIPDETKPGGIFATEIQAPGHSGRRADLIWQGCTAASGHQMIGHEVKVTRADLATELADLTKSDPWQRFCQKWYLVLPDIALADGFDLPPTWGVLTPPSGRRTRSMTIHVKAPTLTPHNQVPALRTLAAWLHWRNHDNSTGHRHLRERVRELEAQRDELQMMVPDGTGAGDRRQHQVVARILRELGGVDSEGTIGGWYDEVSIDDVVAVLKDVAAANGMVSRAQDRLDSVRGTLRSVTEQIEYTLKHTVGPARRPSTR